MSGKPRDSDSESAPTRKPLQEGAANTGPISTAAIIHREGQVLVGLRSAGGDVGNRWEFPGGKAEPGESSEDALRRELREELGIEAVIGARIAQTKFSHRGSDVRLLAFEVTSWTGTLQTNEHRSLRWVAAEELGRLALVESDRGMYNELVRSGFFESL